MLSTFWGLLLGIIMAAVVTVLFGDRYNALLRGLVIEPSAAIAGHTTPQTASAGQPDDALEAIKAHAPSLAQNVSEMPSSGPSASGTSQPAATETVTQGSGAESTGNPETSGLKPDVPLPEPPVAEIITATAGKPAAGTEAPPDSRATAAARTGASPGAATPLANPGSTLARKWADYATRADSLEPRGDFRWRDCFTRAAAAHDVPETLLLALASGESGFDPAARSAKDAVGLMQIRWPQTSRHLGIHREADLYDPCTNIAAGARYIAELSRRYDNDLHRAVAAYNYGPGRINSGALPAGARWYSQYIYQHLQRVLGQPHTPSSQLLPAPSPGEAGFDILVSFNQAFRARDFIAYLQRQEPTLDLAQRSEALGRHDVVMLYDNAQQRRAALAAIGRSGIKPAAN